jgi:predicted HTH transcriptional regulator
MFNLIDIGERAGSGIPNIYSIWDKQGWEAPIITEDFEPPRITMSLSVLTESDDLSTPSDKKALIKKR